MSTRGPPHWHASGLRTCAVSSDFPFSTILLHRKSSPCVQSNMNDGCRKTLGQGFQGFKLCFLVFGMPACVDGMGKQSAVSQKMCYTLLWCAPWPPVEGGCKPDDAGAWMQEIVQLQLLAMCGQLRGNVAPTRLGIYCSGNTDISHSLAPAVVMIPP